jgi:hypothetical protein
MFQDTRPAPLAQGVFGSLPLSDQLYHFCRPLLQTLDGQLDRRLVQTFLALLAALLLHRHREHGLLLSELGGVLLSPAHAPAGTKRISRLLQCVKWKGQLIEDFLWQQATTRLQQIVAAGERALCVWDESELEKPESLHLEGLCPVRSTKVLRRQRIKPGYFNPPAERPTFVPGFHWLAVQVMGFKGSPTLAHLEFWSTRGSAATDRGTTQWLLLADLARRWGRTVVHVWDRGFASKVWLTLVHGYNLRFIVRWNKRTQLLDAHFNLRTAGQMMRGKRSTHRQKVWDARRRREVLAGVCWVRVFDPDLHLPLSLVASRFGPGRKPWYLVTNEPIFTAEDAWRIVFAYARRWQIEMLLRIEKCELGIESLRVKSWEARCKVFGLLALVYAFLLSLLDPAWAEFLAWLLRQWCHRTGHWRQEVSTPVYRLRYAISRLWFAHPPPMLPRLNSG